MYFLRGPEEFHIGTGQGANFHLAPHGMDCCCTAHACIACFHKQGSVSGNDAHFTTPTNIWLFPHDAVNPLIFYTQLSQSGCVRGDTPGNKVHMWGAAANSSHILQPQDFPSELKARERYTVRSAGIGVDKRCQMAGGIVFVNCVTQLRHSCVYSTL